MTVFRQYDPHFIARSLDEAYLDITEQCVQRNMTSEAVSAWHEFSSNTSYKYSMCTFDTFISS